MKECPIAKDLLRTGLAAAAVATLLAMTACGGSPGDQRQAETASTKPVQEHADMFRDVDAAVAVLEPTAGNDVHGTVTLRSMTDGVEIRVDVSGLEPGSTHGFHIHEYGDITADDGTAAGGHYNPDGFDHALPTDSPRHAGDLGNIHADADGVARDVIVVDNITIAGLKDPVLGRALIVHAKPDDGSQPTGAAGARIAQGVIGVAKGEDAAR